MQDTSSCLIGGRFKTGLCNNVYKSNARAVMILWFKMAQITDNITYISWFHAHYITKLDFVIFIEVNCSSW